MGWKTLLGAVVGAVGYLGQQGVIESLPPKVGAWVTAAGAVLAAVGLRHAIAKGPTNGQ